MKLGSHTQYYCANNVPSFNLKVIVHNGNTILTILTIWAFWRWTNRWTWNTLQYGVDICIQTAYTVEVKSLHKLVKSMYIRAVLSSNDSYSSHFSVMKWVEHTLLSHKKHSWRLVQLWITTIYTIYYTINYYIFSESVTKCDGSNIYIQ